MDPDSDPDFDPDADAVPDPSIFIIDLQDANKKLLKKNSFPAYYLLKVLLHNFSKIIGQKKSQNSRNSVFLTIPVFA